MAAAVPAAIYREDRATRRRVAKDLQRLREEHEARVDSANRICLLPDLSPFIKEKYQYKSEMTEAIATLAKGEPKIPVTLLACSECHRLPKNCTCVEADGSPLRW